MKCPRCWADKAYLREFRGWRDIVFGCLAFKPMRCSHCYHCYVVHWFFTIGEQVVPPVLRVTGREEGRVGRGRQNGRGRRGKRAA